ncbi:MAG: DNA-binding protein [Spirochaetota bacterium]|jgi:uncharacterized OB-fold protein|nr:DNA-binding protein [Spirochaetota bacterium]
MSGENAINFEHYGEPEHHVYALICPKCGKRFYPSVLICDVCHTRRNPFASAGNAPPEWEKEILEGPCTLLSWTRVFALPEGFTVKSLDFCIVEFPNKLRASGRLEAENPEIGMPLIAHVEIVNEKVNMDHYGFIFSRENYN